jgi:hypothetical protein
MCVSDTMGRNTSTPTRTQIMMNAWSQVQARRRKYRQGYRSIIYSDNTTLDQDVNNNPAHTDAYSNGAKCYGKVPAPIDIRETW